MMQMIAVSVSNLSKRYGSPDIDNVSMDDYSVARWSL